MRAFCMVHSAFCMGGGGHVCFAHAARPTTTYHGHLVSCIVGACVPHRMCDCRMAWTQYDQKSKQAAGVAVKGIQTKEHFLMSCMHAFLCSSSLCIACSPTHLVVGARDCNVCTSICSVPLIFEWHAFIPSFSNLKPSALNHVPGQ